MPPTRFLLATLAGLLLLGSPGPAQVTRDKIYSRPEIPSKEALERLNLRLAWRTYVPTTGARDALTRVELDGKDLIVLTRSGTVQRMDAETGKVHWRTTVGKAYTLRPYVAANHRSVYVGANAKLYGLDRATGRQKWDHSLASGISASPVVDEEQIYVPSATTRLTAFYLPFVTEGADSKGEPSRRSAIYGDDFGDRDHQPKPTWSDLTNLELSFKPVQTPDVLFVVSPSGKGIGFSKILREGEASTELYTLTTDGKIRVAPGSFGDTAYVGSDDAALYAINITTGRLRWRHISGTPITQIPAATDKDVFVTSDREGLARIDRESGNAMWRIPSGRGGFSSANLLADRFLAANDRFVYATDFSGRLLVLDRKRGTRLSTLDTRDYRVPVVNEVTDRVYLASNDGLIVCLHDRDVVDPIRHRKVLEDINSPLVKILETRVTEPGGKDTTLRDVLEELRKKYKVKIVIAEAAFKNAGIENIQDQKIIPPRTEDKPLKDHLLRLFKAGGVTYQLVDQVILIIPGKGKD